MNLTVVKMGGSLLEDSQLRAAAVEALAAALAAGERMIVVHGGGKHIDRELERRSIPRRIVNGLRVTDAETLEVVTAVLAGVVNKKLVGELHQRGCRAAGLSGIDASLIQARLHPPIDGVELGRVGQVERVDATLLDLLSASSILPVVACVAVGSDGDALNVNADSAAAAIAVAVGAARIVYLTDVDGYLAADGRVVGRMFLHECRELLASGELHGGMHPKIASVVTALEGGVREAIIAGPSRHSTVLRDGEGGTHLVAA